MNFRYLPATATALVLVFAAGTSAAQESLPARSGAFTVSPLRIDLPQSADHAVLTLSNALDRESAVQIRVFAWHQDRGIDRFVPSQDFVVSPSIFRMAPGSAQQFHIIPQRAFSGAQEARFRVVIDQLPAPVMGADQAAMTRLQLTLPLFVGSEQAPPARLSASVAGTRVSVANAGGRTARIGSLVLIAADGRRWPIGLDTGRYVHGQSTVTYEVPGFDCTRAGPVRVAGMVDRAGFDAAPQSSCP